jgi:hypothetical protein
MAKKKNRTEQDRWFIRGIAWSAYYQARYYNKTAAIDMLIQSGYTYADLVWAGVDEDDLEVIGKY